MSSGPWSAEQTYELFVPNWTRGYTNYYSYLRNLLASAGRFRLLPALLVIKRSRTERFCHFLFREDVTTNTEAAKQHLRRATGFIKEGAAIHVNNNEPCARSQRVKFVVRTRSKWIDPVSYEVDWSVKLMWIESGSSVDMPYVSTSKPSEGLTTNLQAFVMSLTSSWILESMAWSSLFNLPLLCFLVAVLYWFLTFIKYRIADWVVATHCENYSLLTTSSVTNSAASFGQTQLDSTCIVLVPLVLFELTSWKAELTELHPCARGISTIITSFIDSSPIVLTIP